MEAVATMKVMVAIDESDGSMYALNWALDNLFRCVPPEAALVYLAHVQQPFQHFLFPAAPGPSAVVYPSTSVLESVRKAQQENSAALVSRATSLCNQKMIKAEGMVVEGDPKEMLCEAVEGMHIDLLVIGSRGLGTFKRAFLGSVSDYCAHHAKCPILIVKPPKETQANTQKESHK